MRVDLDSIAPSGGTTVVVTFLDPLTGQPAIIPQTISVPAGVGTTGTFTFTIPQTYTPSTVVILARVEPYSLGKYVVAPIS